MSEAAPQAAEADWLAEPGWFPHAFHPKRRSLTFVRADRAYLAAKRFLDARWMTEDLPRREAPADGLALPAAPPQLNFIWHTSFCCSTLIADMLERDGLSFTLREPQVLATLADSRRLVQPVANIPYDAVFGLLARRFGGDAHVTVKPSNFANNLIGEAAARSSGRMLFLYSDLPGFLTAIARKGHAGGDYVSMLFSLLAADGLLPTAITPAMPLTRGRMAALAWHMQMAEFAHRLEVLGPARAAALDCDAFLAAPAAHLAAIDAFLGLGLGAEHVARVVSGPLMTRHAKTLGRYDAAARAGEVAAAKARLGPALDELVAWSHDICGRPALPHPLTPIEEARTL